MSEGTDGARAAADAAVAAARERTAAGLHRSLGSPVLFAVIWTSLASGIYFSLGVVADHALGLTPLVFLIAAVFFGLAAMTYVEGASLHQDRGGATVFARYAFDELWSFVAGWAVVLDYLILLAVTALSATHYASAFWGELDSGLPELIAIALILGYVVMGTIRGFSRSRSRRLIVIVVADLVLQGALVLVGLAVAFDSDALSSSLRMGNAPSANDVIFAIGVATVVLTGLESASGLAGEVGVRRAGLRRLISSATASVAVVYVGIAVVAVMALPVVDGRTELSRDNLEDPVLGLTRALDPGWLADTATYIFAFAATVTLIAASTSAMLGLSRLAYALALNRQIPSAVGRLHPRFGTPFVVIVLAGLIAFGLALPTDLDFLVGIYAFGSLLGLTIAHASIVRLRFKEPDRPRPYRMPVSVRVRGGDLPVPAVVGAVLALVAWASVVVFHDGARYVGLGWMAAGLALYVIYRTRTDKGLRRRVTVPESALKRELGAERSSAEYGSILVPLMGTPLDDDIVQTAGRLAGEQHDDFDDESGATIEALWVFEIPMSLPIDARLPEAQVERARQALRRAKAVGEEYEGVEVATATVRARRASQAIVEEARRRGVEVIVLAAEEPSRIRGGALLGGRGGPRENFVGEVTKQVLAKAPCPVILTAPERPDPAGGSPVPAAGDEDRPSARRAR